MDTAKLTINDQTYDLPVITGIMNEQAVDISELRKNPVLSRLIPDIRIPEAV